MTPRRRPLQRDNLDIETTLTRAAAIAPEVELGWSVLRQEMRDAAWPARTPEGDRKPSTGTNGEGVSIDYADTTGDLALRLEHLTTDYETLRNRWHTARTELHAIIALARKHIPPASPTLPACTVTTCDAPVEMTGNGNYRGMERIAGNWVAKPGIKPVCGKHRKRAAA